METRLNRIYHSKEDNLKGVAGTFHIEADMKHVLRDAFRFSSHVGSIEVNFGPRTTKFQVFETTCLSTAYNRIRKALFKEIGYA